jgi:flavin-dependent dehydrogenase
MSRVAIVGAGPAGAAAGWHLARRGHEVTLFDRAAFPRDKTCGDWLTPLALRELAALGLDAAALEQAAPGHALIQRNALLSPDGRRSEQRMPVPGRCIRRARLDALIVERAVGAGCVLQQRMVKRLTRGDAAWADHDHLVDARGAGAGPPNAVGLRGYWTVPRAAAAALADQVAICTDARWRRGYGWVFALGGDADVLHFNIGVGLWKQDSRDGATVHDFLAHFLARHPLASAVCAAATASTRPVGYPVMLGGWRNRVERDGVLCIGDAAGLADPLTGDGIGNALASGRLLAEAIDAGARWQPRFDSELAPELRRAWLLRQLLTMTAAKNLATTVLDRGPAAWRARLHGAVFGASGYRDLF